MVGISPTIGKNLKTKLREIRFSKNQVSDAGLKVLLAAIEAKNNAIEALYFDENELTNESSFAIQSWLKRQRLRYVEHNFNIVTFNIELNKILRKNVKDVEA